MCCTKTVQSVHQPTKCHPIENVAKNRIANDALETFRSTWPSSPCRTASVRKLSLRWPPVSRTPVVRSTRRTKSAKWSLKRESKFQWKVLCALVHSRRNNDVAIVCMVTGLRWWVLVVPSVVDKCHATSRTKWQHKSANIRLCMETETAKRLELKFRWCSFVDIRRCDAVLWGHEWREHVLDRCVSSGSSSNAPFCCWDDKKFAKCHFPDRRTIKSRVWSPESERSATLTSLCQSCASDRSERLSCDGRLSFAVARKGKIINRKTFISNRKSNYLVVQEDEIHLNENERHSCGRRQC